MCWGVVQGHVGWWVPAGRPMILSWITEDIRWHFCLINEGIKIVLSVDLLINLLIVAALDGGSIHSTVPGEPIWGDNVKRTIFWGVDGRWCRETGQWRILMSWSAWRHCWCVGLHWKQRMWVFWRVSFTAAVYCPLVCSHFQETKVMPSHFLFLSDQKSKPKTFSVQS